MTSALALLSDGDITLLTTVLKGLGDRHVGYNVPDDAYGSLLEAFIWALGRGLGEGFTEEHEAAWRGALTFIAETMIEGGKEGRED